MRRTLTVLTIFIILFLLVACKPDTPNTPTVYTISFDVDGGNEVYESLEIEEDSLVIKPDSPTKDGFTFEYWMKDGAEYNFNDKVTSNFTLKALWTQSLYVTFTYDTTGVSDTMVSIVKGSMIERPVDPVKEDHEFKGWYLNDELFDFTANIDSSITLTAKWEKLEIVYVEKNLYTLDFGSKSISGYDSDSFTFKNILDNKEYTLNKQRAQIFTNTTHGFVVSMAPVSKNTLSYVQLDLRNVLNASKVEFNLGTWSATSFNNIKSKTAATIKFEKEVNGVWTALPDSNNNIELKGYITSATSLAHIEVQLDGAGLYRISYSNTNSSTSNTENAAVIDDLSVYQLEKSDGKPLTITFDEGYVGSSINAISVIPGQKVEQPDTPVRTNYEFVGWYLGNAIYDFDNLVSSELLLVARWELSHYVVTYDLGHLDVSNVLVETVGVDELITEPAIPERDNHTFNGWYQTLINDDIHEKFVFDKKLTQDIRLIASWTLDEPGVDKVRNDDELLAYYSSINGLTGEQLVLELRNILTTSHTPVDYGRSRQALEIVDRHPYKSDQVLTFYDRDFVSGPWNHPNWEREHVWPNSKLGVARVENTDKNQGSDLHNLRAIIPTVNQRRNNFYFNNSTLNSPIGHVLPESSYNPGKEDSGDVARILMYMAIRYEILSLTNNKVLLRNEAGNYEASGAYMGMLSVLYEWHLNDPVDAFEVNRNNVIDSEQNNRNPFIDHPELFKEVFEYFVQIDEDRATNLSFDNNSISIYKVEFVDLNKKQYYM